MKNLYLQNKINNNRKQLKNEKLIHKFLKFNNLWKSNLNNIDIEKKKLLMSNLDNFISFVFENFDIDYNIKILLCEKMLQSSFSYNKLIEKTENINMQNNFLDIIIKDFYENLLIMYLYLDNKSIKNQYMYIYDIDITTYESKKKIFNIFQKTVNNCMCKDVFPITTLFYPVKKMLVKTDDFFPEIALSYIIIWNMAMNQLNEIVNKSNDLIELNPIYKLANIVMSVYYNDINTFLIYNNLVIASNGIEGKNWLGFKVINPDLFTLTSIPNICKVEDKLQFEDGTILEGYQKSCLLRNKKNIVIGIIIFHKKNKFTEQDINNINKYYSFL